MPRDLVDRPVTLQTNLIDLGEFLPGDQLGGKHFSAQRHGDAIVQFSLKLLCCHAGLPQFLLAKWADLCYTFYADRAAWKHRREQYLRRADGQAAKAAPQWAQTNAGAPRSPRCRFQ
jgi:hypothetical protein